MPATAEAANASKKTYTNWEAFAKAGLIPATLRCQSYKPVHLSDSSCHSNLKFDAATLKRHFDGNTVAGSGLTCVRPKVSRIRFGRSWLPVV